MNSNPETAAWVNKTPADLIAEFHSTCDVKPGNVTYEDGLIVFRYPRTGLPDDRLTRAKLQEIIDDHRRRVAFVCQEQTP